MMPNGFFFSQKELLGVLIKAIMVHILFKLQQWPVLHPQASYMPPALTLQIAETVEFKSSSNFYFALPHFYFYFEKKILLLLSY